MRYYCNVCNETITENIYKCLSPSIEGSLAEQVLEPFTYAENKAEAESKEESKGNI
jgi:hypothetical protein